MTTYLLDSDITIELLRGRNVHVAEQLASRHWNAIFLSTVTVAELMFGALRSRKPQESILLCRQFCAAFQLAELDQDAGERSGVIRADLEGRGERIGVYDVLIAGIAMARGHVLATHNVRESGRVAGLSKTGRRSHRKRRGAAARPHTPQSTAIQRGSS